MDEKYIAKKEKRLKFKLYINGKFHINFVKR